MPLLANAQATVASAPGTGTTVALGAARPGGQTWSAAGATDGALYSYRIDDTAGNWELQSQRAYTASGATLARGTPQSSSSGGSLVNFGADAFVSQIALPIDLPGIAAPYVTAESINNPGYRKWSDGLIEQWARITFSGGADQNVSWPISLQTAIDSLVATVGTGDTAGTTLYSVKTDSEGLTSANFRIRVASNGGGVAFASSGNVVGYYLRGR